MCDSLFILTLVYAAKILNICGKDAAVSIYHIYDMSHLRHAAWSICQKYVKLRS